MLTLQASAVLILVCRRRDLPILPTCPVGCGNSRKKSEFPILASGETYNDGNVDMAPDRIVYEYKSKKGALVVSFCGFMRHGPGRNFIGCHWHRFVSRSIQLWGCWKSMSVGGGWLIGTNWFTGSVLPWHSLARSRASYCYFPLINKLIVWPATLMVSNHAFLL